MNITYTTPDPAPVYTKSIRAAKTLDELQLAIALYENIAEDALTKVEKMNQDDFKQFRKDLPKFSREDVPGTEIEELNEKWGDIIMPRKMLFASLLSLETKAPWGVAYLRSEELGWPWDKKHSKKKGKKNATN